MSGPNFLLRAAGLSVAQMETVSDCACQAARVVSADFVTTRSMCKIARPFPSISERTTGRVSANAKHPLP